MSEFEIFSPVARELNIVETQLQESIHSPLDILHHASVHLVQAGGKRLRPAFALIAARFYREDLSEVIPLATALELLHMASLVHDDVIDNSDTRRGTHTVKSAWGNRVSIYTGNFLFARSLSLLADYERRDIVGVLADASMKICEGEIIQMMSCYNVNLGLKNYLRRIERKTALLISVSCQVGAMLCNAPQIEISAHSRYGYYLGMAFQITDDILDLVADEKTLGKPTGSDIKQGVITLPALYALKNGPYSRELAAMISSPECCQQDTGRIIDMILESDGIDYAYHITRLYAEKARRQIERLPDSPLKETYSRITNFITDRDF
ncbi:MAG TPA: polyprenyl synthetase family protein [Syntrophomonadaceae bacterium]|nr:polyprenyl synthetase family protein [Syntrophomonadaceae bacterium]